MGVLISYLLNKKDLLCEFEGHSLQISAIFYTKFNVQVTFNKIFVVIKRRLNLIGSTIPNTKHFSIKAIRIRFPFLSCF